MRTIKFRGRDSNGNWHYGDLEHSPIDKFCRIHEYWDNGLYKSQYDVNPATVGQFTGLTDADGKDIYEGDIVRYQRNNKTYQVVFKDGIFCGEGENGGCAAHFFPSCEIVGNIHDKKGGNNE